MGLFLPAARALAVVPGVRVPEILVSHFDGCLSICSSVVERGSGERERARGRGLSVGVGIGNNFRYRCIFCVGFARGHELEGLVAVALWLVCPPAILILSAGPTGVGRNLEVAAGSAQRAYRPIFVASTSLRSHLHRCPSKFIQQNLMIFAMFEIPNAKRYASRACESIRGQSRDGQLFTSELMTKTNTG